MAKGEKSFVELGDLINISRLELSGFFGVLSFLGGFALLTRVHSWGLVVLVELLLATVAKEGVELVVALVDAGARTGPLARAFALDSIWRVADSKLAT